MSSEEFLKLAHLFELIYTVKEGEKLNFLCEKIIGTYRICVLGGKQVCCLRTSERYVCLYLHRSFWVCSTTVHDIQYHFPKICFELLDGCLLPTDSGLQLSSWVRPIILIT